MVKVMVLDMGDGLGEGKVEYEEDKMMKYNGLKSKSEKIRMMDKDGFSRVAISKMLGIRYQHVRNVLVEDLRKKGS